MAKRYPTDSKEDLGAKRQKVEQRTAGEDSLMFEGDPNHFLDELYNITTTPGRFSDVTLELRNGERMEGHSVILAAMSPYLKTQLKAQRSRLVDLKSITKDMFMKLLDYTFHGRLQVKFGEELKEMLDAAGLLEMEVIRVKCEEEFEQRLTVANCLQAMRYAEGSNHHTLVEATEKFVVDNLEKVSGTAGWWTQTEAEVTAVCRAAKRHRAKPETLAKAILEWLEMNKTDPDVVTKLMKTSLFPLEDLSVDYITTEVMPHQALRGNHEAIQMAMNAIQTKLPSSPKLPRSNTACRVAVPGSSSDPPAGQSATPAGQSATPAGQSATPAGQSATPAGQSATPAGLSATPAGLSATPAGQSATPAGQSGKKKESAKPKTLLVAGWRRNESVLYHWQWGSASWSEIPIPRHGLGAAMLYFKNQVFVTGGRDPESGQNRIVKYTPLTKTSFVKLQTRNSTDGPPMLKARSDHGMVKIGKAIYVAGGDKIDVEEYIDDRKFWTVVGKLHSKVKKCGVGVSGEVILVVGGSGKGSANVIQAFNTRTRADATLVGLLPMAMPAVRCAGTHQGKIVCLSREGKMFQIAGEADKYAISPSRDLREMTADFDATISGLHIVVCTGHLKDEVRVDSKGSVFLKYKLQDGKEVDCEIPSLPELLRVYGLTTTRVTS